MKSRQAALPALCVAILLGCGGPVCAQAKGYCCYGREQSRRKAEIENYCYNVVAVNYYRAAILRLQGHTRQEIRGYLIAIGYDQEYADRTVSDVFKAPKLKPDTPASEVIWKVTGRCEAEYEDSKK